MATDMNKVFLIGRVVRDPEVKYTQSGTPVTSFSLAVNKTWNKDGQKHEQVSFFNCIAWGKLGEEVIAKHSPKGTQVSICGRLQQRSWETSEGDKRSTVEVVVDEIQLLSKPRQGGESTESEQPVVSFDNAISLDEEIPF